MRHKVKLPLLVLGLAVCVSFLMGCNAPATNVSPENHSQTPFVNSTETSGSPPAITTDSSPTVELPQMTPSKFPPRTQTTPSLTPEITNKPMATDIPVQSDPPIWGGIIPGITSREEVIEILGEPFEVAERNDCPGIPNCIRYSNLNQADLTYFVYEGEEIIPETLWMHHMIFFVNHVVWLIIEDTTLVAEDDFPIVDRYIESFGTPKNVWWSTLNQAERIVLFCEFGIFLEGNQYGIGRVYYFQPMTAEDCVQQFSAFMAVEDPFPKTDFIMKRDPWGFTEDEQ